MIISTIVAAAKNGVIGKDNQIPWYLSEDLKFFKRTTINHHIIMGRKCFESIGRPLPKRTNIIVTRNPYYIASGCLVVHSIEEALELAQNNGETEAFIIGGGMIYEQSAEYWDRVYFTEVHAEVEGDIFFPKLDTQIWNKVKSEAHQADAKNEYDFTFQVYERIEKTE